MKKIIEAFVRFPFYANLFIFVTIVGGLVSLGSMKQSFFPEWSSRQINVSVTYLGASPKEMEEGITAKVEEAVRGLVGIKEINSYSSENMATIRITTTGEYDIDLTLAEVKNAVDGISSFPLGAERPIVYKQREVTQVGFISLNGNMSLLNLKKISNRIEEDFLSSGVITQLSIMGFPSMEISVDIREQDLLRYNLTHQDIIQAVQQNNQDVSAGLLRSDDEELIIRSRGRRINANDISNIIIHADDQGRLLRINDVANTKLRFSETPNKSFSERRESATIMVNKLANEDLGEISEYLHNYIEEFNADNNEVKLEFTYDFLENLHSRLDMLKENGLLGLLLVLIVLGFFLSLRLSFWVAFGIPISFMGMLIVAGIYGVTINMISLFGMILVIGILVDDGIVIGENIFKKIELGKHPRLAAVEGTIEMVPAVFTSVITTCIAFSPLFFATGRFEFMFEMAFVVVVSLLISLIEAFFVLPAHLSSERLMKNKNKQPNIIRRSADKAVKWMSDKLYAKVLKLSIQFKGLMLVLPLALIILTAGLFKSGAIQSTFFPSIPFDMFNLNIAFTPGSGEMQTERYLWRFYDSIQVLNKELNKEFNNKNGYDNSEDFIKYSFVNIGNAFDGEETGAHSGSIRVILKNMEGSPINSFDVVNRLRAKIGPIPAAEKFSIGARSTFGTPVAVAILGSDLDELQEAKSYLLNKMRELTQLKDVKDNSPLGKREILIEPKESAYFLGINRAEIARQVRNGFFGGQAQRLQIGRDEVRVYVRYPKDGRINMGQLENLRIKTPKGSFPLKEIADFKMERGPVTISRYNGRRQVLIEADLTDPLAAIPPILSEIERDILPYIKAHYPGVSTKFMGQSKESDDSMQNIMKYFAIAFAIIVLIIMLHFKSVIQGTLILMMIPLGWLGAIWGHGIEGTPISLLSTWGMIALSGVIINDAVVFLTTYNNNLKEGMTLKDAVYKAGISRFRPIVLTTLTTSVGLYPLILETSFQAKFLIPMAISLAYGVFIGTGFILTFFPALILGANYWRRVVVFAGRAYRRYIMDDEAYIEMKLFPDPEEVEPAIKHQKKYEELT